MDFALSLSHPELASSSGLGQSMPILESGLPYSVWMAHPDDSINFVSYIQPLKYSGTLGMTTPPSATGCESRELSDGRMSSENSPSDPSACSRAIPISRADVLSLIGFLICRLLIGTRSTQAMNIDDRPIRSWARLNREIFSLVSVARLTEEPKHGGLGAV